MTVSPIELQGVAAHAVRAGRLGGRRVHRQESCRLRFRLARLAAVSFTFVNAGGTGTGIAQQCKVPLALVAVLPFF